MSDLTKTYHSGRRNVIKAAALGAAAIAAPFIWTPSRASTRRIVIRDAGGVINEAYKSILYEPFKQKYRIEVIGVAATPNPITQIRTMVDTGNYLWDMAVISRTAITLLTTGKIYLEKHELENDPVISQISPQFMSPYGVGANVYTTVLAYRTDAFRGKRAPETWKDLWDTDNFPGRRSLRKYPSDTVEQALMADGVPLTKIYPCDLDRAFRSLDKIKPHIHTWWTSGVQTEQLLKSGEVSLLPVWIARAQAAINAGAPVAFSWKQHIYHYESWAILKGTPNAELCRQFIQFASEPERQARLATHAIGPTQANAFKYFDSAEQTRQLPSDPNNLKQGLYTDAAYWAKHQEAAIERFNRWILA